MYSHSFVSLMNASLLLVLLFVTNIVGSDGAWCICRSDQNTSALQSALDYACGSGADCSAIQQTGGCYSPNTVVAHCSYAANSYYQRKDQTQGACDFSGTATLTSTDPSSSGCTYPASPSAARAPSTSRTSPTTNTSTTTSPPTTFTPTTGSIFSPPGTTTTSTGTNAGVLGGLAPLAQIVLMALKVLLHHSF
uniref:X8 domain-containing protein n=1 Tax=Ananas comosus var. bracteatus TaxID=296719 RepID=A0A6V7PNW1_ANACO|nr:unnamed protein product [Ananas comosus var. bracteatus]